MGETLLTAWLTRTIIGITLAALVIVFATAGTVRGLLVDNGDGTVTDSRGLMWIRDFSFNAPMLPAGATWDDARNWAESLVFAGHDDWRLPSATHFSTGFPDTAWNSVNNEWGHLYGAEWGNPSSLADIAPMTGYSCLWYWTDTEDLIDASQAYGFFVSYNGLWVHQALSKSDALCATAVRGVGLPQVALPPVACFTESASVVLPGTTIHFDPSCSFALNATIILYEWDFDGDGTFDQSTSSPTVVSFTYETAGIFTVTLKVTDSQFLMDTTTATKSVWEWWIVVVVIIPIIISIPAIVVGGVLFFRVGKLRPGG